jgi:radical SAM superfamily enzyme YgiQ (UPF0313 family)
LVTRILQKNNPEDTPGISFLQEDLYKENVATQARITDIDALPWPAWHLFSLEPYFQPNFTMGISEGRNMAMLATRGCPFRCTFCSSPSMWTTRYVMRDVKEVVDEIEFYKKQYGIKSIDFYDLTAIVKKQWILDFTRELKHRKLDIVWQLPSGTRSEVLDAEVLEALAQTRLKFLVYAPESGSEVTLKKIKKQISLQKMTSSIRKAKELGIIVKANFVIGFPEETRREIFQTLRYCWRLAWYGVDDVNVCQFSPYPGSELFDKLKQAGKIGTLDDEYFKGLMTQFDLWKTKHFNENLFALELVLYRVAGLAGFYALSYLLWPGRLLRLIKQTFQKKEFRPGSLFEQRLSDMKKRRMPSLISLGSKHA